MGLFAYSGEPPGILALREIATGDSYLYVPDKSAERALQEWPPNKDSATFGTYRIRVKREYHVESRKGSGYYTRQFKAAQFLEGNIVGKKSGS